MKKEIKISKIINVSPLIITKNGERLYFVTFEGSFWTGNKEEVNDAVQEAIEYLTKYKRE